MMRRFLRVGGLAVLTLATTLPAMAQSLEIGPGGLRVVPDEDRRGPPPGWRDGGPPPPPPGMRRPIRPDTSGYT